MARRRQQSHPNRQSRPRPGITSRKIASALPCWTMPRAGEDRWHRHVSGPQAGELSWFSCSATILPRCFPTSRAAPAEGAAAARAIGAELIEQGDHNPPFAACLRLSVSAWALPMSPALLWTSGSPKSGRATAVRD